MVREADLIRSEIDQTRSDLDSKLMRLEARAREMTPRRYAQRFVRERVSAADGAHQNLASKPSRGTNWAGSAMTRRSSPAASS